MKRPNSPPREEHKKDSAFKKAMLWILKWLVSQLTYQKILVAFLVYKGVTWVDQSYQLAWAGFTEIASDLSRTALTEILGVAILYSVKAIFENLSKNNSWPDKSSAETKAMDTPIEQTGDKDTPVG